MQLKIQECNCCKEIKPIVNRKHGMCNDCNKERLGSPKKQYVLKRTPLKPSKKRIRQKSNKQKTIDKELHRIYFERSENEDNVECSGCGRTDKGLDNSHIIKRSRAQQLGKQFLIVLHENIVSDCRDCHMIHEHGTLLERQQLLNHEYRMAIIKKYDPQGYQRLIN